ncbi:MAG TPA: hypothetical protein VGE76_20215 [Opitutaceae bacterium]
MRTFLLKLLIFALLVAGGFALLLRWHPKAEDNQYVKVLADKEARLLATPPPRLLLVGGSNLAFGVDSAAVERALGRPALNLAVTMEFGREFILHHAAAHARDGDIVVLSLEYYGFTGASPEAYALAPALEAAPGAWRHLDWPQWKALLDGGLVHLGHLARTSLAHARGYYVPFTGTYRRDAFTAHGDMISHHGLPGKRIAHRPLLLSETALRRSLDDIAAFVARCKAQGATVYFELPPWPENWVQAQPEILARTYAGLRAVPHLTVLNTPAGVALPGDAFYDTEYHLTQTGAALRTERLIQALSAARAQ